MVSQIFTKKVSEKMLKKQPKPNQKHTTTSCNTKKDSNQLQTQSSKSLTDHWSEEQVPKGI